MTIDVTAELTEEGRLRVIAEIVSTKSYSELKALVDRGADAMKGRVAAFALLQVRGGEVAVEDEMAFTLLSEPLPPAPPSHCSRRPT